MKNKFKKLILAASLSLGLMTFPTSADATSYTVKEGESFWSISKKFGVTLASLQKINNRISSRLYTGESLTIPASISNSDIELLARLVHAEAKGEPYAGKVAVATVVLNRVDHPDFPNTVKEVIYQKSSGYYAFSPVQNGEIYQYADSQAIRAVYEAIAFRGQGNGSLFFFNPQTAVSKWVFSREVTVVIGNHRFAK